MSIRLKENGNYNYQPKFHEYCNIEMPSPNNNILKYNQGEKSLELPFIIYADLNVY